MAPIQLQARSQTVGNCVAQVAAVTAPAKGASSSEPLLGVDPLLLGAAWRTVLGVRALSNPDGFSKQFKDAAGTKASKALALRCGLLNLQVAALQVAACNADMKTKTKRNLHAAMALNNFSSAGLAMYNAQNNGLASNEANARMAVTVCLGALAAVTAMKEHNDL